MSYTLLIQEWSEVNPEVSWWLVGMFISGLATEENQ